MKLNQQLIKKREATTGHAVFSPSQLYRIILCPASAVEATKAPIQPSSPYAQHGTMLHDVVKRIILNGFQVRNVTQYEKLEQEDMNHVLDCVDYAWSLYNEFDPKTMRVEEVVSLQTWGLGDIWGTADLSFVSNDRRRASVTDWKFGSGVQVFAENNEQGMAYAAGVVGFPHNYETILINVVQPPLNHFDTWVMPGKELSAWVFDVLTPALQVAANPDPPYHPGEKQCRFCPAAMTCRARYKMSLRQAEDVFRVHSNLPNVTKDELSAVLDKILELQQYMKAIQKYADDELAHGRSFPGWKRVSGRSIRSWDDEEDALNWLAGNSSIPEDKLYTKKPISPAQAEKIDRTLKQSPVFSKLIVKPPGNPQLVREDDPRPALEPEKEAAKAFEDVAGEGLAE